MNVSADQVRAATSIAAAVITADSLPPLRLHQAPGAPRRARTAWFAPLAAAAAVVILIVSSVTAGSLLGRTGKGQSGALTTTQGAASAAAFSSVPPYYVALGNPKLAVVRATATGHTLVRIPTHVPFVGVTGAADDRTFVLDAQSQVMGPEVLWPDQPAFYLLKLTASGAEASYTRLAIPALPKGIAVTGLALSPDGSKLAIAMDTHPNFKLGLMEISIYTLATGAVRTWTTTGSGDSEDPAGFTGSGTDGSESISWTADSKTLAFDWTNRDYIGVRLLDTTSAGDNLITDSRLAVIEMSFVSRRSGPPISGPDEVSQCVTDTIISGDGSSVVCGYTTNVQHSQTSFSTTSGFIRYSTATGKQTGILGLTRFSNQAWGDISLFWVNSKGTVVIGEPLTPNGPQAGVISGDTFTPLPGVGDLNGVAW
jgi:hypothetical protein